MAEIRLDPDGEAGAWIACPGWAIPAPGQYGMAHAPEDGDAALATPLFCAARNERGFYACAPIPRFWTPGMDLELRSPLGRGFHIPENVRRLALAALAGSPQRLLSLAERALASGADAAFYCDASLASLPASLEVHPLNALPEALAWADFIAIDLRLESLPELRSRLGMSAQSHLPCPAQALLLTPMPCGGMADCGACAVPGKRGWKLACKDGPVFNLDELDW